MTTKPTILIVGTDHFDKSNVTDLLKTEQIDVFSNKRQNELLELMECLKGFAPTKVALEYDKGLQMRLSNDYQNYLSGKLQLTANERHQIGFRMAEAMEHKEIYAVDWNEDSVDVPDVFQYMMEHEPEVYKEFVTNGEKMMEEVNRFLAKHTIVEFLAWFNKDKRIAENHQMYIQLALVGEAGNPVGVNWVMKYWYYRNMLIYKNIIQLASEKEDRILVLYGAGHAYLLKQLLQESGLVHVELTNDYLEK
ncbi:hypothetical protein AJ85_17440 [Alkalihalobacillus alcalophilus ATCC 27647 = CGMCC 1.3604]|uniref:Uncharacterized protein n=1 Tax=Alkalihalobacillus alcalophilus ATCC 27647 = CGMCC 1.3604 TaxID=1218173 RepID=A0A094WED8_ALKAL|nr:DUF5694 domain-containing protein [Alkalihalobacillus alcalophilus]KGA96119.1 hypothetical protein BALCAV_0218185 [Alkalihalobacillus alcalophilus ATCC 27647 = CGMCC 1.3604]MED1564309.1 DUF5694 domain-containing protein [Alkalihalobacillus alcalophilus]THG92070.1 hypothetical protein AJ85_17440 [Alkalihalobacillus alcalophilus ATCC 27647 = CGMCC 1.3604]